MSMKCPHCLVDFHEGQTRTVLGIGYDADGDWILRRAHCPSCDRFVLHLAYGSASGYQPNSRIATGLTVTRREILVWPVGSARPPAPPEVPPPIAEDYKESCRVLDASPKASAALSRRCLQNLIRSTTGIKQGDLSTEIQQVLDSGKLPSQIAENIDAIRNIGNFAAHPTKSATTGEIVPVEPGEAEWNLDVLESLFDFYFVQPARAQAKRDALNKKLADANKLPIK